MLEQLYRDEFGRILASLIRLLGDFDLAEEAAQEAFATAVEQWQREGVPQNPRAWIIATARHKAIDRIRRETRFNEKRDELIRTIQLEAEPEAAEFMSGGVPDERLRMIESIRVRNA